MAQEIADSTLLDTWASSGLIIEPDISKIIEGWQLGEQPPHEYMNWLQNTFGSKLNHILKNGVAKWNNETEYLVGSSVQHNGNIWLCKTTNTNSEPTELNANWEKVAINKDLTVTVDTLADLRSISYPANTVWASGYHTKNDGAFGSHIFRLKGVKTTEIDNGGTIIIATIGGVDYVYELQFSGAVNVKWFGAVGDGITEDSVYIQSAFDNIDDETSLFFPAGVYIISNTIVINKSIHIYSKKATLKISDTGIATGLTIAGVATDFRGIFAFKGGDGNRSISSNSQVLTGDEIEVTVSGISFVDSYNLGDDSAINSRAIGLFGTINSKIKDCSFVGIGAEVIYLDGTNENVEISNNVFKNCAQTSIGQVICNNLFITNNTFIDVEQALELSGERVYVRDNHFIFSSGAVSTGNICKISDNSLGVNVYFEFTGNTIRGGQTVNGISIYVQNDSNEALLKKCLIENNVFDFYSTDSVIKIAERNSNFIIKDNIFYDSLFLSSGKKYIYFFTYGTITLSSMQSIVQGNVFNVETSSLFAAVQYTRKHNITIVGNKSILKTSANNYTNSKFITESIEEHIRVPSGKNYVINASGNSMTNPDIKLQGDSVFIDNSTAETYRCDGKSFIVISDLTATKNITQIVNSTPFTIYNNSSYSVTLVHNNSYIRNIGSVNLVLASGDTARFIPISAYGTIIKQIS